MNYTYKNMTDFLGQDIPYFTLYIISQMSQKVNRNIKKGIQAHKRDKNCVLDNNMLHKS